MTTTSRVILITGANRGIGLCIAQSLGFRNPRDALLIASRNPVSADAAIAELRSLGVKALMQSLALDVTDDESIKAAVQSVADTYGRLDVLVNNAGIASVPAADLSNYRDVYNTIYNTNVTSVGLTVSHFTPLLKQSHDPRVINVSSGRASISRLTSGEMPPTISVPYSVSKVALNVMTLEMGRIEPQIKFYLANPGHCKTALNEYKGKKDPLAGANVVTELVHGEFGTGFWQNDNGPMEKMPW